MLFMKGNKLFPQCGFSNTAVMILKSITEDFETFDVLADNEIREGIRAGTRRSHRPPNVVVGRKTSGQVALATHRQATLAATKRTS